MVRDWRGLFAEAARYGGLVRLADGPRFGISTDALVGRARREGWAQPFPGVRLLPGAPLTPETRMRAALASVDGHAWIARASVLYLLGLIERPPPDVQLLVPGDRHIRGPRGVAIRRSRRLPASDLTSVRGMPTTTLARAVADLAADWPVDQLRAPARTALQEGLLSAVDLRDQRRRTGRGCRGAAALDRLITDVLLDGSESELEWATRRLLASLPVQPYPRPMPWRAPDGVVDHLDIAYPAQWVAVLCDGRRFHTDKHTFTADRRAWNALGGAWLCLWLDAAILRDNPYQFLAQVAEALGRSDPSRRPARPAPCRCRRCAAVPA